MAHPYDKARLTIRKENGQPIGQRARGGSIEHDDEKQDKALFSRMFKEHEKGEEKPARKHGGKVEGKGAHMHAGKRARGGKTPVNVIVATGASDADKKEAMQKGAMMGAQAASHPPMPMPPPGAGPGGPPPGGPPPGAMPPPPPGPGGPAGMMPRKRGGMIPHDGTHQGIEDLPDVTQEPNPGPAKMEINVTKHADGRAAGGGIAPKSGGAGAAARLHKANARGYGDGHVRKPAGVIG
jgi:hypothetical protein